MATPPAALDAEALTLCADALLSDEDDALCCAD
jgi:hypothetical protein